MVERVTVAVDANGAYLGPAEVARGAALAAGHGIDVILFGPAGEMEDAGVEVVDAPVSIAKAADPARAARTMEAPGVERAAEAGSGDLAIETGASTTVTPGPTAPMRSAGPYRRTRRSL
jgi:glycerol-3-phosphate acyltransferase PlsX